MTIATRLILSRRSRPSRPHEDDVESNSASPLPRRRHHHRDELEVSPRSAHHGRFHSRRSSHSGHESARLDHNCSGEFATGTSSDLGNAVSRVSSRLRSITSERLPGAVLEARARLLERLRNVSLSETRQTPATGGISWDEFLVTSDLDLIDSVNLGAENLTDFTVRARGTSSFNELHKRKSPGLGWSTLCSLCQEVYTDAVATDGVTQASLECGICLEKFVLGDELIKLQCSHRFHLTCLEPWVRSSGDCPYCRASIIYQ
ncbi:putative transcription factor C2H2 family [Dioscorea sansibarensis]